MSKYNVVYKITNELNGKIYIGCHQTEDLDDDYMGSGKYLHRAFKKYGIENFTKEILFKLDSFADMFEKEALLVNEDFVKRQDTYNLMLGGKGFNTKGFVTVRNKDNVCFNISVTDPRYLSGELVSIAKNRVNVKDKNDKLLNVFNTDPKYLSGEYTSIVKNTIIVKDNNGKKFRVNTDDPRYLSGKLVGHNKDTISVKDNSGNFFRVNKNDPRYLSGELVFNCTGNKLSNEHKEKISKANKLSQKGERNSQYGKCWITNEQESKRIYKGDPIPDGWRLGRKIKK